MTVHHAAQGFRRDVGAYERGRPAYPEEAVSAIAREFGLSPSSTILDLAAGTGKFTRALLSTRARLVAVEPLVEMRAQLVNGVEGVEALEGTAESIPLADKSVDAVTVAQAFHWFANDAALAEIHRVLRSDGGLALIWNRRDLTQPLQRAVDDIVNPFRRDTPSHRAGRWRVVIDTNHLFALANELHVSNMQELDAPALVDRVMSTSFIAELYGDDRERVTTRLEELISSLPARFSLAYVTDVHCYRSTMTEESD
ncbi:MAG: class I SAM-dependent methyltransferase [Chloroflexota bacterium]|nr:MAG: SAM-dependent methyltransferase [Chloroflexota bacterium]